MTKGGTYLTPDGYEKLRKELEIVAPEDAGQFIKDWNKNCKRVYNDIENEIAFFDDDVVFIPLRNLEKHEIALCIDNLESFSVMNYMTLSGFGSEMGHLVADELYGQKTRTYPGLGEAVDYVSWLYQAGKDVGALGIPHYKKQAYVTSLVRCMVQNMETIDALLMDGEEAAKEKLKERYEDSDLETKLERVKEDYDNTNHYDGYKIFLEAYANACFDLDETFKILHEVLSSDKVQSHCAALIALGWDQDQLYDQYAGIADKTGIKVKIE